MQAKQLVVAILTPLLTGSATFGAIVLQQRSVRLFGASRVHAAAQSTPEPEALLSNWPQQCVALRQELLDQPELSEVTYEARPLGSFVTPAWKLNWQGEVIALPLVDYDEVRVARNEDEQLMVVLEDSKTETRVMLNRLRQSPPMKDVFATAPHPDLALAGLKGESLPPVVVGEAVEALKHGRSKGKVAHDGEQQLGQNSDVVAAAVLDWDGPSLTERLFDGPVALEQLIDQGYRHRPQALSCEADAWEKELPIAMGLALKLVAGSGDVPEAVYAKVGHQPGRLLHRLVGEQTVWQARLEEGEFYSDVMISLPTSHESAAVGMGMGQENWWDAEPRPEWLIALERAVEVDSEYAWNALSVEVHRAGMSDVSAQSIQGVRDQ